MKDVRISVARRVYWSLRRELWENRSVYLAPAGAGCMVLVGFAIALFRLPARMQAAQSLGPQQLRAVIEQPYLIAAIILMAVDLVIAVLYCVDAFYGERRDRSVLFWKSMPVSDAIAVVTKASIPILLLPVVTFAVTVATQAVMLLASTVVLAVTGIGATTVWDRVSLVEFSWINFGHLVVFHGLWSAPLYAWFLLVSAWATRVPFLWALVPPVAIGIIERIAFNSTRFITLLQNHFAGGADSADATAALDSTMDMLVVHPLTLLSRPAFWMGLVVSAFFLAGAVRLRRSRSPM